MAKTIKNKEKKRKHFVFPTQVLVPVKKFLIEELKRLKLRKKQISEGDPFKDENRTLDNTPEFDADEEIGHLKTEALKKQVSKRMVQIKKALTMIKIGHYGICAKCHKFIDTERLTVYPETTLCVDCIKKKKQ